MNQFNKSKPAIPPGSSRGHHTTSVLRSSNGVHENYLSTTLRNTPNTGIAI